MFTEVKQTSKPLPQLVSEEIEKLIVLGEFKPGDRLPSEYELAQRLGVGRSTVREATKALVSRNILEVHRGNGTFVCEQTGLVQDPLGLRFQPDKKRLGLDLCEVRLMIEPEIAALAAQKATEEEIARMQALCDAIEEKVRRNENYGALDQQLHTLWAACTRNAIMPNLVPILSQAIPLFIDITKRALQMQSLCTHQAVVDAIRARDSEAARQAMRVHLEDNRRSIEALPDDDSSALTRVKKRPVSVRLYTYRDRLCFFWRFWAMYRSAEEQGRSPARFCGAFHRGKASVEACRTAARFVCFFQKRPLNVFVQSDKK